jgi:hypothetical protein
MNGINYDQFNSKSKIIRLLKHSPTCYLDDAVKDRYLWEKSFADQLNRDLASGFQRGDDE